VSLDPNAVFPLWSLGSTQRYVGRLDEAITTLERAVELFDRHHTYELALLGDALAAAGREPEARAILRELDEMSRRVYVPPFDRAIVHASLGENEAALDALERAHDERNALLWFRIHFPQFDGLRKDPRWKAITARLARTAPVRLFGLE
jgi:tetratricopeptide (TPR) repeat protein